MSTTFISIAREAGDIRTLTPIKRTEVLRRFEEVEAQHCQMFMAENLPTATKTTFSIYHYESLTERLEHLWNSSKLPSLQQEHEMLKRLRNI